MNYIWIVVLSNSYGDFGDSHSISYHGSKEGAIKRMDEEAITENLKDDIFIISENEYVYGTKGRELSVQQEILED